MESPTNTRLGLAKNYLRYVHEASIGVVAASQVGSAASFLQMRNTTDRYIAVPANEDVLFWDLKTKEIINRLNYDADNAAEVTTIDCHHGGHPRTNLIAVGYANGQVKVYEYETGQLKATFTGHRTAISALAFDKDGTRLVSGGKDCNIVLWDIVGERGLFSLKGHKNSISKLAFLYNEEHQRDILVSSSIDAVSTIKFWDLQIQHCFCTIPGQANGVWSFALMRGGTRLVTGSTGPELKVYSLKFLSESERKIASDLEGDQNDLRLEDPTETSELEYGLRVKHLDKNVEFYGIRADPEALAYAKKQAKKAAKKQSKRKRSNDASDDEPMDMDITLTDPKAITSLDMVEPSKRVDCEFNRKLGFQRLEDKVKSLTVTRFIQRSGSACFKIAVVGASNKISCYNYSPDLEDRDMSFKLVSSIESPSHRTDVRAVAISEDNSLLMSASSEAAKFWRYATKSCIATIDIDYALCCVFANAQHISGSYKNRFAIIGTKAGSLQIIDIANTMVIKEIPVTTDSKPVNSICVLPDRSGLVCGGEDGVLRIFDYVWSTNNDDGQAQTYLDLEPSERILKFSEGITCVKVSANSNLVAVSLLDSTVRVHFLDTFKYFLTMYGHKFPVTTMDISDDSTLLITGSPDKNIKIWGLDFGDCHKSIFAHDDAITCVRFVPKTHYAFSSGRDRQIKQWDCDRFIKIQTLKKHMAEIWCFEMSPNGRILFSGSHDKSMRIYRKTEEILIPKDEEETEREVEDERNVFEKQENIVLGESNQQESGFASKMTIETVKSTDRLIEAIDVFEMEQAKELDYAKQCEIADSKGEPRPAKPETDPMLLTTMSTDYRRFMLEVLRRIRSSELEEILITLPFDYVRKLLSILVLFLEKRWDVELMIRCAVFLLKVNFGQIAASPAMSAVVNQLKAIIIGRAQQLRECSGFNLLALEHLALNRKYQSTRVTHVNSF